jgi:hypothetical protein
MLLPESWLVIARSGGSRSWSAPPAARLLRYWCIGWQERPMEPSRSRCAHAQRQTLPLDARACSCCTRAASLATGASRQTRPCPWSDLESSLRTQSTFGLRKTARFTGTLSCSWPACELVATSKRRPIVLVATSKRRPIVAATLRPIPTVRLVDAPLRFVRVRLLSVSRSASHTAHHLSHVHVAHVAVVSVAATLRPSPSAAQRAEAPTRRAARARVYEDGAQRRRRGAASGRVLAPVASAARG